MKFLSNLSPSSLTKYLISSTSITQQLQLPQAPQLRVFRVTNADRTMWTAIIAGTMEDLMDKVSDWLPAVCVSVVLLGDDGSEVDTEECFQSLPENTVLMVLEKGQKWTPHPSRLPRDQPSQGKPMPRTDVAKLTLNLYKNNPRDFIGCLNVKITLYGAYTMSYDLRCHAAKNMLKEALRWTLLSMQATGHILLGSSRYMEQLLEADEQPENGFTLLLQQNRIRQMGAVLLGKMYN